MREIARPAASAAVRRVEDAGDAVSAWPGALRFRHFRHRSHVRSGPSGGNRRTPMPVSARCGCRREQTAVTYGASVQMLSCCQRPARAPAHLSMTFPCTAAAADTKSRRKHAPRNQMIRGYAVVEETRRQIAQRFSTVLLLSIPHATWSQLI